MDRAQPGDFSARWFYNLCVARVPRAIATSATKQSYVPFYDLVSEVMLRHLYWSPAHPHPREGDRDPSSNGCPRTCSYVLKTTLWKIVDQFLHKLTVELPYYPAIPLLGIYPEELKIGVQTKPGT